MSTKDQLLEEASIASYFTLDPENLEALYNTSSKFLSTSQSSLDEDSLYTLLYQHFHLALLTGNDAAAKVTVQRLSDRFGDSSPYVGVLKSEYLEATENVHTAQKYLSSRETTDFAAFKRKTVALKQKGDYKMYIQELLRYLDICPADAETWAELAEAYVKTGLYQQSVHALQEVLIMYPQAYNVFARIGEITHIQATITSSTTDQLARLKNSIQHYLRAVELCPVYVRGWSGVYVVTGKLLKWPKLAPTDSKTYTDLHNVARKQLQAIVDKKEATPENLKAAEMVLAI